MFSYTWDFGDIFSLVNFSVVYSQQRNSKPEPSVLVLFCLQLSSSTRVTTIFSTSTILVGQDGETSLGATLSPKISFTGSTWIGLLLVITGMTSMGHSRARVPLAQMVRLSSCTQVKSSQPNQFCGRHCIFFPSLFWFF